MQRIQVNISPIMALQRDRRMKFSWECLSKQQPGFRVPRMLYPVRTCNPAISNVRDSMNRPLHYRGTGASSMSMSWEEISKFQMFRWEFSMRGCLLPWFRGLSWRFHMWKTHKVRSKPPSALIRWPAREINFSITSKLGWKMVAWEMGIEEYVFRYINW